MELYIARYGDKLYRLFDLLGIFNIYGSWWFQLLLALLIVNVVVCTRSRLPRILSPGSLARREWIGRLGPHITHLSLIVILAGSLIGNLWGFKAYMNVPEGTVLNTVALRDSDQLLRLGFTVRCDKFDITYYPGTQMPKEYRSDLAILENGCEVFRKTIRVNEPLKYKGISLYQASYGVTPPQPGERRAELEVFPKGNGSKPYRLQIREGETIQISATPHQVQLVTPIPDFSLDQGNRPLNRSDQPNNPAAQVNIYQNGKLSFQG